MEQKKKIYLYGYDDHRSVNNPWIDEIDELSLAFFYFVSFYIYTLDEFNEELAYLLIYDAFVAIFKK